ncbi:MAG TPA: TonB-dependent receptor, partial [Caulobacteraceae bacterium]|nr:TonB-dependent receptor [Caulobacteraceae bacterium]
MSKFLPPLALALAAPSLCLADTDSGTTSSQAQAVASVVVTATRLPTELVDTPDVIVINRDEIDQRQVVFAADLLDTVPGLAVTDDGAFGGVTSIRMRGASSDKTLVLIDGVPQNDPSDPNGAYDFSNLDLADVQRIEILQGPQSSLWGSDAIGGVIAFTTRELDGWRAAAEGGSLATFDGSAGVGKSTDTWALGASISGDRSDGVAKADGIGPANPYWEWTTGGYGRLTPAGWLTLDAHLRYEQSYASIDGYNAITFAFGYTPQYYTTSGWTGDVRAIAQGPWGFTDTLSVGFYDIDRSDVYIGQPEDSSAYNASSQQYRFTAERGSPSDAFGLIVGAERDNTRGTISTGQALDLGTTAGFAVVRWRPVDPLTLTASERYDAPDSYAGAATGHVGAVLKLPKGLSLEAAAGQGFKIPTISEIACDFCFPAGPSTDLKPEHAFGWDAALGWALGDRVQAKVTTYQLFVTDQIEYAQSFPFRYANIDRTRTNGLEATLDLRPTDQLTLEGEYAYTDARDLDANTQMLRVPRNTGSATLYWHSGRWQASVGVRGEGPDADEDPSTFLPATRPGFALASLTGSYDVTPRVQLTARIQDVADTH